MKKIMKKAMAAGVVLSMLISVAPSNVHAQEQESGIEMDITTSPNEETVPITDEEKEISEQAIPQNTPFNTPDLMPEDVNESNEFSDASDAVSIVAEGSVIPENAQAQIGEVYYETLVEAFNNVKDGETISLANNVEITQRIDIKNTAQYTLDLNGHTLTNNISVAAVALYFYAGNVTLTNSQEKGSMVLNAPQTSIVVQSGVTLNLKNIKVIGTYENATIAFIQSLGTINVYEGTDIQNYGYGIYVSRPNSTLNMEGGVIKSQKSAAVNGNGSDTNRGTIINITGGELYSAEGPAMYLPQIEGVTNISGGTISGITGVEIRAGQLNVSGSAVITGTGSKTEVNPNANGFTTSGAGIAVAQHTTKQPIEVNITGGTISAYTPFYESNPQGIDPIEGINLSIAGGIFHVTNGGNTTIYSQDCTGFIAGGAFGNTFDKKYLSKGFNLIQQEDGTYSATDKVVTIGDNYYSSLKEAVAAAQSGDMITLLYDVELSESLVIDKTVTLNLNQKTIKGQIKIDNAEAEVTITNGTLSHDGMDPVNATLHVTSGKAILKDNLVVEATANQGAYGVGQSAVIAVYGELEANGVKIIGNDWGIGAYRSCKIDLTDTVVQTGGNPISSQAADGNTDMVVNIHSGEYKCIAPSGDWKYSSIWWTSHGTLNIEGGTFTSTVSEGAGLFVKNGTVNISGGTFTGTKDGVKITSEDSNSTEIHVNITGGTFEGTRCGIYTKTKSTGNAKDNYSVNVEGGTFNGGQYSYYTSLDNSFLPIIEFKGGTFNNGFKIDDGTLERFIAGGQYTDRKVLKYLAKDKAALYQNTDQNQPLYMIQEEADATKNAAATVVLNDGTVIYVGDTVLLPDFESEQGVTIVDYSELIELSETCEQLRQSEEYKDYTDESKKQFEKALEAVYNLLAKKEADQTEVDQNVADLEKMKNELTFKSISKIEMLFADGVTEFTYGDTIKATIKVSAGKTRKLEANQAQVFFGETAVTNVINVKADGTTDEFEIDTTKLVSNNSQNIILTVKYGGNGVQKEGIAEISIRLKKAIPTPEQVTGLVIRQGQPLRDIKLPEQFKWVDETQTADDLGIYKFKAIYTPEDTTNYEIIEVDIEVEVVPTPAVINHAPTISASDKTITVGDKFDSLKGVMAKDREDGDLTSKIKVVKNMVNAEKVGSYEVTYQVTDSQGASVTKTIKVTVKAKTASTDLGKEETDDNKPENSKPNSKPGSVETGDQTNVGLYTFLLTVSALSIVILAVWRKKKEWNR